MVGGSALILWECRRRFELLNFSNNVQLRTIIRTEKKVKWVVRWFIHPGTCADLYSNWGWLESSATSKVYHLVLRNMSTMIIRQQSHGRRDARKSCYYEIVVAGIHEWKTSEIRFILRVERYSLSPVRHFTVLSRTHVVYARVYYHTFSAENV